MSKHRNKAKTASGRHLHNVATDMLYRAGSGQLGGRKTKASGSPNRVWHSPRTGTIARSALPKTSPKYRPDASRKAFTKQGSLTHDRNGIEIPDAQGVSVRDHYEQRGVASVCITPKWQPKPGTPKLPF